MDVRTVGDLKIYLVRQDIDHLIGEFFVSAVVVADSASTARRQVIQQVRGDESDAAIELARLRVVLLGAACVVRLPTLGVNQPARAIGVVNIVYGEDYDL